jgi:DNA-binding PucR family transcriptional regulator
VPVSSRWEPPTPVVAEQIRAVAERLHAGLEDLIRDANAAILGSLPALESDPVLAARTRESTSANITRWVTAMAGEPDHPVGVDVPPQALDLARDVVRRGMERDALLSSYRLGQNVVWGAWMRCAREEGLDADDLIAVLDVGSRSLFGYVDGVLAAIAAQIEQERDELIGGALARRRETVALILDGAPILETRASARLGYELGRVHTAAIAWSDETPLDQGELENAVSAVARDLGAGRPFSVPAGTSVLWAWISGLTPEPDDVRAAGELVPAGVRVTLGSPLPGITGFRDSHTEALAAQRLLMRAPDGPRFTTYSDVQVVSLASQDEARAAAFVAATLGDLRGADSELLETVRVYLQQDSNAARAAALLYTHRNTVLKRIGRADALLPQPLAGNGFKVRLALELLRWRGD